MKIFIEQLEFTGPHGVYEQERRQGRTFRLDLEVTVEDESATDTDRLDETVDYAGVAEVVEAIVEGESRRLVEKLAGDIAEAIFERFPPVHQVRIRLRKHAPGVAGSPRWVGVELTRDRPRD